MLGDGSRIFAITLKTCAVAAALAFLYGLVSFYTFGGRFLGLEERPTTISEVDVSTGDTVTPEMLMGWLEMERDAPLFGSRRGFRANDLRTAHERVSANATLASLTVSREFSGKVTIRATERIPLMRIAGRGLAIDSEGYVFSYRKPGMEGLVALEGSMPSSLESGNRVVPSSLDASILAFHGKTVPASMGVAALRLADFLADGVSAIKLSQIRSVNTDSTDYLKVLFKDGRTATLAWDCMKSSQASDGRDYLAAQLDGLAGAMSSRAGRNHRNFDFTIKGRGYGK